MDDSSPTSILQDERSTSTVFILQKDLTDPNGMINQRRIPRICHRMVSKKQTEQGRGSMSSESQEEVREARSYEHTRKKRQATPAFKLLTYLLYSGYSPCIRVSEGREFVYITNFRQLGRMMGTSVTAYRIRNWLLFLEDRGYIDSVSFSQNLRTARIRLRPPRNVGVLRV